MYMYIIMDVTVLAKTRHSVQKQFVQYGRKSLTRVVPSRFAMSTLRCSTVRNFQPSPKYPRPVVALQLSLQMHFCDISRAQWAEGLQSMYDKAYELCHA